MRPGLVALLLLAQSIVGGLTALVRGGAWDAEEQANCDRVSQSVDANAAPLLEGLERQARQRFGRSFAELSPEEVVQLSMSIQVQGGR